MIEFECATIEQSESNAIEKLNQLSLVSGEFESGAEHHSESFPDRPEIGPNREPNEPFRPHPPKN